MRCLHRGLAILPLLTAFAAPAGAVVFTQANTATGPSLYSGVAQIDIAGLGGCSGTLLTTGMHILTAGHCAAGASAGDFTVTFRFDNGFGAETIQSLGVTSAVLHPLWDTGLSSIANILRGVDFAVLTLTTAADTRIDRYDIDRDAGANLAGAASTVAGFGQSGVGANNAGSGTRRAGDNEIQGLWSNGSGLCRAGLNLADPSLAPLCTVLPLTSIANLGVSSFGDSGGALFVNGLIAGVNSFVKCGPGVTDCSPSNPNATTLGTEAGAGRVSSVAGFIDSVTGIPEPSTVATLSAGLLAMAAIASRRKQAAAMRTSPPSTDDPAV
jgi:hypothetical protein